MWKPVQRTVPRAISHYFPVAQFKTAAKFPLNSSRAADNHIVRTLGQSTCCRFRVWRCLCLSLVAKSGTSFFASSVGDDILTVVGQLGNFKQNVITFTLFIQNSLTSLKLWHVLWKTPTKKKTCWQKREPDAFHPWSVRKTLQLPKFYSWRQISLRQIVNGTFNRMSFSADHVLLTHSMHCRGCFRFGGRNVSSFNVGFFIDIFQGRSWKLCMIRPLLVVY